ncbi:patatin-like phospholipase family protein [Pendulispora brunnea]|uniref:Patatin-like phospholipase family protein n=1 Tax=Pendulispora brunnea TaxID=2905690 RepID=A0ABZ2KNB5_9BACT
MKRVALILAGGAARGAYEVGVVAYLLQEVSRALGRDVPLDILCGTSVGALNVAGLAAYADEPRDRAQRLVDVWRELRVGDLVKSDLRGLLAGSRALLDTSGLEKLVADKIPFARIGDNLARGMLTAVTISTTHVASGKTIVFVQRGEPGLMAWGHEPTLEPRAAILTEHHALASAAIPILFRPVLIDGQYYCDGGLRQNVPLSPARRLGADGLLIVNPRYIRQNGRDATAEEEPRPGPLLLFGKALNSLLLDRLDTDLARLEGINRLLSAGTRRFGPGFVDAINEELGRTAPPKIRPLSTILVRASEDIGKMSVEFVRSPKFQGRVGGPLARVMRRLAEAGGDSESDLLSYVLFDGEFASELIDLGWLDAKARHDELCAFFESMWTPRDSLA